MGDYFRHARAVSRSLEWARQAAPVPVGGQPGAVARRHPVRRRRARPTRSPATLAVAVSGGDRHGRAGRGRRAHVDSAARRALRRRRTSFRRRGARTALLAFLKPRAGLYARLSEMHDCGLLGRMFPEFQAISCRVVRDFYHKYTVDEHTLLTIRNLERLADARREGPRALRRAARRSGAAGAAGAVAALPRRRQVARRRPRRRERPDGAADDSSASQLAGGAARARRVPDSPSHSGCRWSRSAATPRIRRSSGSSPMLVGIEERLKMLCLLTLADVEAVSPETLTPWREELLWRLYVDTYNHLTLELRRRAASSTSEAGLRASCSPAGPPMSPRPRSRGSSKGCRAATCSSSRTTRSTATSGCRATSGPTTSTPMLERKAIVVGADRGHARQAVPVLEHLRRAVVVRHGHPARPRDDQPERPGARRVPVHRPGAVPRAERRRRSEQFLDVLGDVVSGRADVTERLRRPRAERPAPAPRRRASTPVDPRRQPVVAPLHDPRHHRRATRSACCIASAASSRSTAATSTWC